MAPDARYPSRRYAICDHSNPIYHDKNLAREHFEAIRWPDGPICPHCGVVDHAAELQGKAHRPSVYKCRDCRKQFSVTVGTVFERSKVPLIKGLLAGWQYLRIEPFPYRRD